MHTFKHTSIHYFIHTCACTHRYTHTRIHLYHISIHPNMQRYLFLTYIPIYLPTYIPNYMHTQDEVKPKLSNTNLVINELVREYLEFNKYKHTNSVFIPGTCRRKIYGIYFFSVHDPIIVRCGIIMFTSHGAFIRCQGFPRFVLDEINGKSQHVLDLGS